MSKKVGVLALQGGFSAHVNRLSELGAEVVEVRRVAQLETIQGLIIPGGESTALLRLMAPENFFNALSLFHRQGKIIFGTCAGMILLANKVRPQQQSLQLIDIEVARNAYGRQVDSFIARGEGLNRSDLECVFIRAPKITYFNGQIVETLIYCQSELVMARQDNVMVASFHPELSEQQIIHQYFLDAI